MGNSYAMDWSTKFHHTTMIEDDRDYAIPGGGHLYLLLKPSESKFLIPYLISLNLFKMTKKNLCVCSFTFDVYTLNIWNFYILR